MEAAWRAVARRLLVGCLLSWYLVDPKDIVRVLRGPWQLIGDVTMQRVDSGEGRFVLNFEEEGDMLHKLLSGPWHLQKDGVVFAEFDGRVRCSLYHYLFSKYQIGSFVFFLEYAGVCASYIKEEERV